MTSIRSDDIYIDTIRYAIDKNEKVLIQEITDHLNLSKAQTEILIYEIQQNRILTHNRVPHHFSKLETALQTEVWASAIDRFRLIEHDELIEARKSASSANRFAIAAIIISVCLGLLSLYQGISQSNSSKKTDKEILESLTTINSTIHAVGDIESRQSQMANEKLLEKTYEITNTLELIEARRILKKTN